MADYKKVGDFMKNIDFSFKIKVISNFENTQQSLLIITFNTGITEKYFINTLEDIPKKLTEFIQEYVNHC